jgi:inosose dehydratase
MQRRSFLASSLALPALPAFLRASLSATDTPFPIGYASITWGGDDETAIREIAALGYRGIQLRATPGTLVERWRDEPDRLRDLLAEHALTFVALSSGVLALDPAREAESLAQHTRNAELAARAGCLFVQVVDERPRGREVTAADHARMGGLLTTLGRRFQDLGVRLGYHNHMGNLGQSPGEVAAILDAADPAVVALELDTAHWRAAGGDPVQAIRQYRDRLSYLHLKDVEFGTDGRPYRFRELGHGVIDFPAVLAALREIAFTGWGIVELDSPTAPDRSPKDSAQMSRAFLTAHGHPLR